MNIETFLSLSTEEVANLVRQEGPKVCFFFIDGTRRWFQLEHSMDFGKDYYKAYLAPAEQKHVELWRLLFDHGIEYLLAPGFRPDFAERSDDYLAMAARGLARFGTEDLFLDFFRDYDVRVRFYGDYSEYFKSTPYAYLTEIFDDLMEQTSTNNRHHLLFGLFAHDATETIAKLAIKYHRIHGRVPDKRELIELYYGEYVPPVNLFIAFGKFRVYDMPMIAIGEEDLYFTVSPSIYFTEQQFREILFDHLYSRRIETDYSTFKQEEWNLMREFYQANMGKTLGIGNQQPRSKYWYPLPQVEIPLDFI